MAAHHFDLIVIGSGPAGEKGAAQAAYFGKKVAVIERAPNVGGAGINTGTVPSKTLRETALYFSGLRQRGLYGINYSLHEDLSVEDFMYRKRIVVESEWDIIRRNLERHDIQLVWGEAAFCDAHTVRVRLQEGGETELTADFFLIATGSAPFHPPGVPFEHPLIYDSDSILHMHGIPKTMAVVGGGVIGTEYASIFVALGVEVILIDSRQRLLPFVDGEIAQRLQNRLEQLGVRFVFNSRVESLLPGPEHVQLNLTNGASVTADCILYAAGRQSNVEGLGLDILGVALGERGLIEVNDKYQTNVPYVYAAGDVIGFPALASTSMEQARVAMAHAFDLRYKDRSSPVVPLAVYAIPEISMTGLSEEDCQAKGIPYLVGRAMYAESPRGQIIGDTSGMLKLIFSPSDKKVLGVHILGEMASELIHLGSHVIATNGTIDTFIESVYNYPTLSDSYKYAAYDGLSNLDRLTPLSHPL
ncbi:MAG: Si-specific NAD(P)(+) transhydrogenase [Saprospirales bacterium]|nr:Si-specific NAD(P)(+) transhydrogenase [Saprospirales bacterium]